VYDLWANRMDGFTAQKILDEGDNNAGVQKALIAANWYNSTAVSYADGLEAGDERLFGKKVSTISPGGSLTVNVKRHSAEVFRLRTPPKKGEASVVAKDEL